MIDNVKIIVDWKLTIMIISCLTVVLLIMSSQTIFATGGSSPTTIISYTPSTETHCTNNICTQTIYSGVRFVYEDNIWKKVEDAKSLKSVWGKKYLEKDADFDIDIVEVNYSYINLDFSFNSLNYAKYSECAGSNVKDIKCDFKLTIKEEVWNDISKEFDKVETKFQYKFQEKNDVKIDLKFSQKGIPFGKEYTFGGDSTTITLNESNLGNIGDTLVANGTSADFNYGSATVVSVGCADGIVQRTFIKWNLSLIPIGSTIINANMSLMQQNTPSATVNIQAYNTSLYNSTGAGPWNEGNLNTASCLSMCDLTQNITWATQPSLAVLQDIRTNITVLNRIYFNITNASIYAFSHGMNMSILLKSTDELTNLTLRPRFYSKEQSTISQRPQLEITYEEGVDEAVLNYWGNSTQSPTNYTPSAKTNFSVIWQNTTKITSATVSLVKNGASLNNFTMTSGAGVNATHIPYYANLTLGAGIYNYTFYAQETGGAWNNTLNSSFIINKSINWLGMNSNVSSPTKYPNASQVLGAGCIGELTCTIYRGNSSYSSATGKDDVLLGVGIYAYNYSYPDTNNYTANSAENFTLVVNQGIAIPLLFILPESPITYNTSTNASCYDSNEEQQFFLYRDYANISDTENDTLIILPAGTWNYECNATATENYTSVATSQNYVVEPLYISTHITINGTESDKTYYYPNTTNVTAWNDTEIPDSFLDLYRNGIIVANPDIQTFGAGVYTYVAEINSSNYTSNSTTRTLTILTPGAPLPTETKVTFGISCDPFWVNFEIIAGFVLGWIGLCVFYILVKKLPDVTRPIIWFILILAMLVLLFSTPYPTDCFTQAQIDFINILIIISIMVSVALGVFSVRG